MNTNEAIKLLTPMMKERFAGKYAREAIHLLSKGYTVLAHQACIDGHFVAGHDGDKSFAPVIRWLDETMPRSKP